MQWPASDIQLLASYLGKLPAVEERIEFSLAQLAAIQVNINRKSGSPSKPIGDFMLFKDVWKHVSKDSRYSELDREFMAVFLK